MPKMFFNQSLKNFRLSNVNQKIKLLNKFKVDFVITKKFDYKFSKTKSIVFIKEILNKKQIRYVLLSWIKKSLDSFPDDEQVTIKANMIERFGDHHLQIPYFLPSIKLFDVHLQC